MSDRVFQAQRLLLARRRRGLNKTQLAKSVSLTPQSIAAYEKETKHPPIETVERLATALRFPIDFFYADLGDLVPLDAASFRSLSRRTTSQADAALAGGTLCIELNDWFNRQFELPEPNIPDLDPRVIDAEGAAAHVRAQWGLGESPIGNVLHLLELHGVRVFALASDYRHIDAFSFWNDETGTPFVCINTQKTPERSVFDLAHELGHLVLHRDHAKPRGRNEEIEADGFASNFLMPDPDVKAFAPNFPTFDDLAIAKRRWRVSVAALNYRMHKLGMISDWHYRSVCMDIAKYGRSREPNSIDREQSQILVKVLGSLRSEGIRVSDIAAELNLFTEDVESLFNGLVVTALSGGGDKTDGKRPVLRRVV